MTWNRYGSEFTRDKRWERVSYEARWHYMAVVAECADSERYDCRIPLRLAERASDVPDAGACTAALVDAGFAVVDGHDFVIVDGEAKHMPPPHMRDRSRKEGQRDRKRRSRAAKCAAGEHDRHCPDGECPKKQSSLGHGEGHAGPNDVVTGNEFDESSTEKAFEPVPIDSSHEGHKMGHARPQNRTEQNRTHLGKVVKEEPLKQSSGLPLGAERFLPKRVNVDV